MSDECRRLAVEALNQAYMAEVQTLFHVLIDNIEQTGDTAEPMRKFTNGLNIASDAADLVITVLRETDASAKPAAPVG